MNIVPFAEVVTSDPNRMDGTRAGRLEEYPGEDLYLDKPMAPVEYKRYIAL